jgi:hypothetical protein
MTRPPWPRMRTEGAGSRFLAVGGRGMDDPLVGRAAGRRAQWWLRATVCRVYEVMKACARVGLLRWVRRWEPVVLSEGSNALAYSLAC